MRDSKNAIPLYYLNEMRSMYMLTINSNNYDSREVIKVEIDDKVYSIPLMKYLKYKDVKKLMALKDNATDVDAVLEIFASYIPLDVLEELSLSQLTQLVTAWKDVNAEEMELGN